METTPCRALDTPCRLYKIRGKSANERRVVRQEKTKPLVATLKTWLEQTLVQVASGSSIAQAIRYGLNHWDGLVRFLDDGRIGQHDELGCTASILKPT